MKSRNAKRGFTLVELLVATAIFALLMSAIAALFVASLHAVRAGYQSQEAFETARGAFNVVERDLSTVFTARDFGQYYQFYGNEYGMSMVGLVRLRDDSGREYTRLGRITYVIYPVVIRNGAGEYYVTEPFAADYARSVGISDDGLAAQGLYRTRGIRQIAATPDAQDNEVCVAALLRYVEPGVSDLDSFPFSWNGIADQYDGSPEFPATGDPLTIRAQLNASLEDGSVASPSNNLDRLARLENPNEQMFAAKKRDLWIRMLSCQEYWISKLRFLQTGSDSIILPNVWGRPKATTPLDEPGWLLPILKIDPTLTDSDRGDYPALVVNPRDYVIAESIGVRMPAGATTFPLRPYVPRPADPTKPFFEYGVVTPDAVKRLMPFWNANRLAYLATNLASDGLDNDGDGVVDDPDEAQYILPTVDQSDITTVDTIGTDNYDNDGDGLVDEPGESVDDARAYGSPLRPRLPEAVMMRLPMIYSSAYLGAPHFERKLEQLIDVPTAFSRSQLGYSNN